MPTRAAARADTADLHTQVTDLLWQTRELQCSVETLDDLVEFWRGVALDAQERADRAEERIDQTVAVLTATEGL